MANLGWIQFGEIKIPEHIPTSPETKLKRLVRNIQVNKQTPLETELKCLVQNIEVNGSSSSMINYMQKGTRQWVI